MAKDGLFFKQATILNKTKFRQKHYGYNVLGLVYCVSGKFGDLLTYATFASLLFYILTILGYLY
jgi:APA family basic amino acid/polyamine antiporter